MALWVWVICDAGHLTECSVNRNVPNSQTWFRIVSLLNSANERQSNDIWNLFNQQIRHLSCGWRNGATNWPTLSHKYKQLSANVALTIRWLDRELSRDISTKVFDSRFRHLFFKRWDQVTCTSGQMLAKIVHTIETPVYCRLKIKTGLNMARGLCATHLFIMSLAICHIQRTWTNSEHNNHWSRSPYLEYFLRISLFILILGNWRRLSALERSTSHDPSSQNPIFPLTDIRYTKSIKFSIFSCSLCSVSFDIHTHV